MESGLEQWEKESDEMHTTFGKEAESRQNISWKVRLGTKRKRRRME